ncbi:dynamin family protein [Fusobacterium animalis]|uniref:dynamin family protein n=1 Tax=Fusobacterium animalis TaxID=76859 RepID=UPI0030D359C2
MKMKEVKIKHNPYTLETKFEVDGKEIPENSKIQSIIFSDGNRYDDKVDRKRFQVIVSKIPQVIMEELNYTDFDITFHGTKLDYQDLEFELKKKSEETKNKRDKFTFKLKHIPAKESFEKINELDGIYKNLKDLSRKYSFQDLNIKSLEKQYEKAKNEKTEVNIVAIMSAGKSTLINSLLGKELLTTNSQACTAKVMEIIDNDDSTFTAIAKDIFGKPITTFSNVTAENIKEMNNNPDIKKVEINGNIPFVDTTESSLALLDSPGTNYTGDSTHKEATLKMIKDSPKVLVLFIIDASNASTNDQRELFEAISESMNGEEDKQLKERFLFVINKIDSTFRDIGMNPGHHLQDIINKIVEPLKEFGIESPNIFPLSAEIAFNIRNINNIFILDRDTIQAKMKFMNMNEEFHLEKYSKLPSMNKEKIDKELKEAIEKNDIEKQALIHSGIRNLEEAINVFVTKYSRPAKVNSLQMAIKKNIEDAKSITETIEAIPLGEENLKKYNEKIEILKNKLSSKEANREFKEKINKLDVTEKLNKGLEELKGSIEFNIFEFRERLPKEIKIDKINENLLEFKNMMLTYQSYFEKKTKELLKINVEETSRQLLKEYINKLNKISEEVNIKEINLSSYINSEINLLKSSINEEQILESKQTRTEYYSDYEWREKKWYNPGRYIFGKDYRVEVTKSIEIEFIKKEEFFEQLLTSIRKDLNNTIDDIKKFGERSAKEIKEEFSNRFDEVDNILLNISRDLEKITKNREELFRKQEEAKKIKTEIERIKKELDKILEI